MFFVGVDLGQANDYTAICVATKAAAASGTASYQLNVLHLERFRHRLYPDVAAHLERLVDRLPRPCEVAVDATGVGPAVTDLLTVPHDKVTITGGDRVAREGRAWRVPKRDLVSGLQVLLQSGRLKIASSLPDAETLRSELLAFRVKVSASGHDSYGAWREKDHDDLVLAACLCAWSAEHHLPEIDPYGELAGAVDPISDADLYRHFDFSPAPRSEWDQDHDVFPSDPYGWGDDM